jgi:hypothetical protein
MRPGCGWESEGVNTRFLRSAGLAVGSVIIGGVAVVAAASVAGLRPSSNAEANDLATAAAEQRISSSVCDEFMTHFATEIGKSQAEISAAFQRAIAGTLADEVKAGHLTQSQAETIRQRLANQTPCSLPHLRPHGARIGAFMEQYIAAAASALGVTEAQLRTELGSGRSLSQVAQAKNVSEADFRTRLIANLKPVLDRAVTDKKITAAQEQAILDHLRTGSLPLWNRPLKHRPSPAATPSAA